eukprot:11264408-Ditylum_brightwellii.AAC.1
MTKLNPQKPTKNGGKESTATFQMDTGPENLNMYEQENIVDQIKAQGVKVVDAAKKYITATTIDFVVLPNTTSYPIRKDFIQLIKAIQNIKPSLTILAAKEMNNGTYQITFPVEKISLHNLPPEQIQLKEVTIKLLFTACHHQNNG